MRLCIAIICILICNFLVAQPHQPVVKDATNKGRERIYGHLINNTVNKNLSVLLSQDNEDRWEDAFYGIQLIPGAKLSVDDKIRYAVLDLQNRSISFQRALLELLFTKYQGIYSAEVRELMDTTDNAKIFAMAGEYLLADTNLSTHDRKQLIQLTKKRMATYMGGPLLNQFLYNLTRNNNLKVPSFEAFLKKDYLRGNVLMISFQRMNRDYPGLVMIRDTAGNFIRDSSGFTGIPQLARSISNLPGYLTNGNTPEGILRMDGFDVSKGSMIGPSTNVQLTLPFEYNASHFYKDSLLSDSTDIIHYKKLLPSGFKNYYPLHQAYYAGRAGRSEIIAHGTAVDPEWYKGMPYYPFTPTLGCLCTIETWSRENGVRVQSDQQKLTDAIIKAGGPNGYAIIINIDNKQAPVTMKDIMPFLKLAGQNK